MDSPLPVNLIRQAQIAERIKFESSSYPSPIRLGLLRLAKGKHALSAIDQMRLSEAQLDILILSCAEAIQNRDTFVLRLVREKGWGEKAEKVATAVQYLRKIIKDLSTPDDSLSAYVIVDAAGREHYYRALNEIVALAESRCRAAKDTPRRIGATRKSQQKKAAENAAIGWLAASVMKIAGRPWYRQSCLIAEVLLGIEVIPEARLRGAMQNVLSA